MLEIIVPETTLFDEKNETFINVKEQPLTLEHSLISLSKWESKWTKPFLTKEDKTLEESLDYIRCMTVSKHIDPMVYSCLTDSNIDAVNKYIDSPMSATTINRHTKVGGSKSREIITAEIIYYWMVLFNIPFECEKWHLNRLLKLIEVCEIKNQPDKKMSKRDTMKSNASLNAARRRKLHTRG